MKIASQIKFLIRFKQLHKKLLLCGNYHYLQLPHVISKSLSVFLWHVANGKFLALKIV